jgi:hypothetical protein
MHVLELKSTRAAHTKAKRCTVPMLSSSQFPELVSVLPSMVKGPCRCNQVTDLEMCRLSCISWFTPMEPNVLQKEDRKVNQRRDLQQDSRNAASQGRQNNSAYNLLKAQPSNT